ncbi:MAG: tetratricopeptide repeat protein [Brachymonas sp.]|nr:tetratricopeptide repeat protein [Brachymonas sp.]MDO4794777.1 tetratricopeptide repeat protein [Brachymonas sp.]
MVINTNKLNLEEQEKIAAVGHFWKAWGSKLVGLTIVASLTVGAVYGYHWYQGQQSIKAMNLYNQVLADARVADTDKLTASLKALQDGYPRSLPAQQAQLLAARVFYEKGQVDNSRAALLTASQGQDKGLQSTAKLQLAALLIEQQQYDEAIKQLSGPLDPNYTALAADRMGDAYALQNQREETIKAYTQAFNGMDAAQPYRQMVAAKLSGLGVDVASLAAAAANTNGTTDAAKAQSAPASTGTSSAAPASASAATATTSAASVTPAASNTQ